MIYEDDAIEEWIEPGRMEAWYFEQQTTREKLRAALKDTWELLLILMGGKI